MSRICVKNLPKYVTEDRLREFFSQKGEVTDAKLMRTIDGKSRQFGFIGYRTEQEAEEAVKYFDMSFLDTSRIACEIARKVGDPTIPRAWSRHTKEKKEKLTEDEKKVSGENDSIRKGSRKDKTNTNKSGVKDDPKLQEFLQVMQPRSKSKLWADDALVVLSTENNVLMRHQLTPLKKEDEENSSLEEVDADGGLQMDNGLKNQTLKKSENLARDEVVSDMDYFKSRVNKAWSDSDSDLETDDDDSFRKMDPEGQHVAAEGVVLQDKGPSEESDEELTDSGRALSTQEDASEEISETGRLFVRNLPYTATEDELEVLFSKFGNVSEVHLVLDKETKLSKGFAFVHFSVPESATRALEELDHSIFQGRLLHVIAAKPKNPSLRQETNVSGGHVKTFKQQREEERKTSEASGNTRAWNSLFMRPDTVVENIARKYGVSKSDLLDREADDLAVRIALGETQIIAETKRALASAGVNVGCLEEFASGKTEGMRRSNHVLLVKNLPYGSTEDELLKMFGKFGSIDKIILPPTRTLALVVFLEPAEARSAFRGLAYRRYKDAPLYLEWPPSDILSQNMESNNDMKNSVIVGEREVKKALLEQDVEGISNVDMDPDRIESRSLFVKNLNFKTTEESLNKHISENLREGTILSIRIKKHLKNGKNVSMGFGFIEFDSVETAANVCRDLQGTVLDGHALILQLCHAKKDDKVLNRKEGDQSSTKLIVRNVAFEATEKDLRQLFNPFGQIKSMRLPMRFGNHRGFAFVEYVTKQEAQNALQALSNTHLYGRRLVLERAKEGESLEELRARTAAQFANDENGFQNSTKISKKRKQMFVLDEGNVKFQQITD
ncbi:hypothetical protein Ancab_019147 [Ancistrocladus abbreviatus]